MGIRSAEAYFWPIHEEAELDLVHFRGSKAVGYEFKYTDSPKATKSMYRAIEALGLDSLTIVVPSGEAFNIDHKIRVAPLGTLIAAAPRFVVVDPLVPLSGAVTPPRSESANSVA